ncbi:uncharacterized protein LOC124141073 [Haliotis rufescens]|uniref:uncharacterized protein LOC124141073 n=1 Tax=Haliotis rufescens TaxID=6454 RepID=UPI001EAFFE31|nr:uncharacterized protein LOC124141073 [Haliotis rufescens]
MAPKRTSRRTRAAVPVENVSSATSGTSDNSRHVGSQVRASATGRAVPYETTVDLRQRLRSLGITVPASWGRKTILQLYKENFNENHTVSGGASAVQHSSPVSALSSVHAVPSCDVTPQYVNSGNSDSSTSIPATVTTASNQLSSANVELVGVMREMRDMMTSLTQRLSSGAPSGENIAWPTSQTNPTQCVLSDSVPHVNFVDESTRRKIHQDCQISETCSTCGTTSNTMSTTLTVDMGLARHLDTLWDAAVAARTKTTYASGFQSYVAFLLRYSLYSTCSSLTWAAQGLPPVNWHFCNNMWPFVSVRQNYSMSLSNPISRVFGLPI